MVKLALSMVKAKLVLCLAGAGMMLANSVRANEPSNSSPVNQHALSIATPNQLKKGESKETKSPHELRVETTEFVSSSSDWEKNYRNGVIALNQRCFEQAETMLLRSIREAKAPGTTSTSLTDSRLALARLYLKQGRLAETHELYGMTLEKAQSVYGENSPEIAECYMGMGYTEAKSNREKQAKEHAEAAIKIFKENKKTDTANYAMSLHTLALVMILHGWNDDAKKLFEQARSIMEKHPGNQGLDLADMLREQSLFYHNIGDRKNAHEFYERSCQITEDAMVPNQPASIAGQVKFIWEPGSTRAQEIIDSDFPFRSMTAHGVRVACTIIDVWELLGILVTVTNMGDHQEEFELGKIVLERVDRESLTTRAREIPQVDPNRIDRIQKERTMWDLTHTRPWLANIQKTRTVRGLVPPNGHDLFMGPNVFGVWGEWKAISHIVPERIGVLPSREGLVTEIDRTNVALPGLVRQSHAKLPGLTPVWLEPFESRTGELFYLYPRDCDIDIKVPVGNAIFQFPFRTRKFKLPRSI